MKAYDLYKLGKPIIQSTPDFDLPPNPSEINVEIEKVTKVPTTKSGEGILSRVIKSFPWQEMIFCTIVIGGTFLLAKRFPYKNTKIEKST